MGKVIQMKPRRGRSASSGRRPARPAVRQRRGSGRGGSSSALKSFLRRNIKLIAIAAGVLVIGVVCLVFILGSGKTSPVAVQTAEPTAELTPVPTTPADETYDYSNVDAETLAGLSGTDDSLFTDDQEVAEALFEEEGLRIGVTVGNMTSPDQESVLNRLEQVSNAAESDKTIYKAFYYNANGNYNQQLQDIRSLIKNEVDVIIVGFTDAQSFQMISKMADNESIPVVAFEAPVNSGYAINVVADQAAWGTAYGKFVADNLTEGTVLQILGKQDDAADAARAAAIGTALTANAGLTVGTPLYAEWNNDKAKEMMAEALKSGAVNAVVTEEGMAEGILDAFVEKGVLPKVMCGDATAGFIKKWYALKNGGIDVTPPPKDDGKKKNKDETPTPTPVPVMFTAQPGEFIVCAQPAPSGVGAAAFDIAVEIAKGRTLKTEGQTFKYTVGTVITQANLAEFYERVKDMEDSYIVSDLITDDILDSLLNPLQELPAATAPAATAPTATPSPQPSQSASATPTGEQ